MLFQRRFGRVSSVHFQALRKKKLSYKYYNKRITTRDNGNHDLLYNTAGHVALRGKKGISVYSKRFSINKYNIGIY